MIFRSKKIAAFKSKFLPKKGQAALEYLLVYGAMLLVIYGGSQVINPPPTTCTPHNAVWHNWSPCNCSVECGTGTCDQTRLCTPEQCGGLTCAQMDSTGEGSFRTSPCDMGSCNDGNLCTTDTCSSGSCSYTPMACDDGDDCNGIEYCHAGTCINGTPVLCDDGDNCNGIEHCVGGGCVAGIPMACDDGNDCNGIETCSGGVCASGTPVDCNDGDDCNGIETCSAGACVPGTPMDCNDGDDCNGIETCSGGACVPGTAVSCNDGDDCNGIETCSLGVCIPGTPMDCNDGDDCNGIETCSAGACVPGIPVVCTDGDDCNGIETCSAGVCIPGTPMPCDDGNACNGFESCSAGTCIPGTPITCNTPPNSDCYESGGTCNTSTGVCDYIVRSDGTSCDDTDLCNGHETCGGGTCTLGTPPDCDDGDLCTIDTCDPADGSCSNTPVVCPDDQVCYEGACLFECHETCQSMGYNCGTFYPCGMAATPVSCGPDDCGCTEYCAYSAAEGGEESCLDGKLNICGPTTDPDVCNDWVDVYDCPPIRGTSYCNNHPTNPDCLGCANGEEYCRCPTESKCSYEGQRVCVHEDTHFMSYNQDGIYECSQKGDHYAETCLTLNHLVSCPKECDYVEGEATCRCTNQCPVEGETYCRPYWKTFDGTLNSLAGQHHFTVYECEKTNPWDLCNDRLNPTDCPLGCNEDLTDCVNCTDECSVFQTSCQPYDSDSDGIDDTLKLYGCGLENENDSCTDWVNPGDCPYDYQCANAGDSKCLCNDDCTLGVTQCVNYQECTTNSFGWETCEYNPRLATCVYDPSLGCNKWEKIDDCAASGCIVGAPSCLTCTHECTEGQLNDYRCYTPAGTNLYYLQRCEVATSGCREWVSQQMCLDGCFIWGNLASCYWATCTDDPGCTDSADYNQNVCTDGELYHCNKEPDPGGSMVPDPNYTYDGDSCADRIDIMTCPSGDCLTDHTDCSGCPITCNFGETRCIDNSIYTCEDDGTGCPDWSTAPTQDCAPYGCITQGDGTSDICANASNCDECPVEGNGTICLDVGGIKALHDCLHADDLLPNGDDCLDIVEVTNPILCDNACIPGETTCDPTPCTDDCVDNPFETACVVNTAGKSVLYDCKDRTDDDDICLEIIPVSNPVVCPWGCNAEKTACNCFDECQTDWCDLTDNNIHECGEANDSDYCNEKLSNTTQVCPFGCDANTNTCLASCDGIDECDYLGQSICTYHGYLASVRTCVENANDGDICLDLSKATSCGFGPKCNDAGDACENCVDACPDSQLGVISCRDGNNVTRCQPGSTTVCNELSLVSACGALGCVVGSTECRECVNDPGCKNTSSKYCDTGTNTVYSCGNANDGDSCLDWINPVICDWGCNPYSNPPTCVPCPYDCDNPGPSMLPYYCGFHDICNTMTNCGTCPVDCTYLRNEPEFTDHYVHNTVGGNCIFIWDGTPIATIGGQACLNGGATVDVGIYRYTQANQQTADGYYEICRDPLE